ncbi:hypothetical protein GCM10027085_58330 [Spirosoma aerophilum]
MNLSSCQVWYKITGKYKTYQENAQKLVDDLERAKDRVYSQVKLVKKSELAQSKKDSLKTEYEVVKNSFNKTYQSVLDTLPKKIVDKGKCIALGYKSVILPQEFKLKQSSDLADNFIKNSNKSLSTVGAGAGVGLAGTIIGGILKAFAEERIEVCKSNIDKLKYKSWDDVN